MPNALPERIWLEVRAELLDVVRLLAPTYREDVKGVLRALGRYLERMTGLQEPSLDLLTDDGLRRFIELERQSGATDSTLGLVAGRLRRVLAARSHQSPVLQRRSGHRVTPFDPYSDAEMAALRGLGEARRQRGAARLAELIDLVESQGLRPLELAARGLDGRVVAALRTTVAQEAQFPLHLHRLRHRWLLRVVSMDHRPLSTLMRDFRLSRDGLETVSPALHLETASAAQIRLA